MRRKIINSIPYILGIIYLAYYLSNINYWIKSHIRFEFYVLVPLVIAVLILLALIALRVFNKKKCNFYLPLFFLIIGIIINVVGSSIPCCTGG